MANKKLVNLDNLDKLSKSLDARYKEKIQEESERAMSQEQILGTEINVTKDMLGGKSIRYITQAEYNNLSESEKNSTTVAYFITDAEDLSHGHENKDFLDNLSARSIAIGNKVQTFDGAHDLSYSINDIGAAPASHTHDDRYYTETEANNKFAPKSHSHDNYATTSDLSTEVGKLNTAISKKSDSGHKHDDYLTKLESEESFEGIDTSISNINTQITGLQTSLAGKSDKTHNHNDDYAPKSHNHDDIYYTDDEVDNLLAGKSDSGHNHNDKYYTESEIDKKITDLQAEIDADVKIEKERAMGVEDALQAAIDSKAPSSHTHDDRYYTESEMNTKLAAKADTNHGTHVPTPQTANNAKFLRNDNSWQTVTPANIGAAPSSHNHNDSYYTKTEINTEIDNINETINTKEAALQASINGKAPSSHNHDDKYYTETEMNGKLKTITDSISSNVSTLNSAIATAKSSAISESKSYTNTAIANLVDSAPEAMNTLNELAEAISNHKDDYEAYVSTVSSNIATAKAEAIAEAAKKDTALHTTISAEIDADVKVEKERAEAAENALQAAINKKSDDGHTHDGRYYTESEINTKLAGKADSSHGNHVPATQTASNKTFLRNDNTWATVTPANIGAAPSSHTHDDRYYTETEINGKIEDINETINTNVATLNTAIAGKADKSHGTHLSLGTTSSTAFRGDYGNTAYNHSQAAHAPSNAQKNSDITKAEIEAKLTGSITSHNHDGQYYTETEINTKISDINDTINTKEAALQASIDGKAPSSHKHTIVSMQGKNTKEGLELPSTYPEGVTYFFSSNPTNRFNNIQYGTVETIRELNGASAAWQFLYPYNTKTDKFYVRNAQYNTDEWREWAEVYTSLNKPTPADIGASASGHTHDDRYFTETEANDKFAPKSHNHDDRYYTETEINGKIEDINETITEKEAALQAGINGKAPSSHGSHVAYGTCATAAATAAKVVSVSDSNWKLTTGCMIAVKFSATNSAGNVTLNVNSTGAYPIWYNNAAYTGNSNKYTGYANRVLTYMFNGTHWVWISGGTDDNSTYTNASLGQGYATCDTAESTVAKVGTLSSYSLQPGGVVSVKFTYKVPASATLNINSKGAKAIYFRGAAITANIIKAGDIATFIYNGSQYQLIAIDRWQNDITSHNHDGRYYTETEINTKISDINNTIDSKEAALQASIDQVEGMLGGRSIKYVTQAQYNNLSAAEKESNTVTYFITDLSEEHDHNDLYYTETEVDAKIEAVYSTLERAEGIKTVTTSNNKLTLTTDKRQYCANVPSGTTIAFPSVSKFTEVHLYFSTSGTMNLNFPDTVKWRVDPNIDAGSSYELVATYVNAVMGWMVNIMSFTS